MSWIKNVLKFISYLCYLTISVFIILEIIFKLLPTSDSLKTSAVNSKNPIVSYEKNRIIRKQIGFNFNHINTKKINNYGYATDRDFVTKDLKENFLVSVIGDSYVEAVQVKNKDPFHAILDKNLKNVNVYPIGMSGSSLSQYLAFANFSNVKFNPDVFVFLIIANDFDESFGTKRFLGFHYFNDDGSLNLYDYSPSLLKILARESAFLRYLHLDLKFTKQLNILPEIGERFLMKEDATKKLGLKAIELFLLHIKKLSENKQIILMVDGDRDAIYEGKKKRDLNKNFNFWTDNIIKKAKNILNIHVLDLHSLFNKDWEKNKIKFNYEYDYHWNEQGHKVASEALTKIIKKLITKPVFNK